MSKKTEVPQNSEVAESTKPAFLEELLQNGKTVLKAPSREVLAELAATIPDDIKYMAGAVSRSNEDFSYTLRIDLIK